MAAPTKIITPEAFFGDSYNHWRVAIEAAHLFAQHSGCPAGYSVTLWLGERCEALAAEQRFSLKAARK